METEDSPLRDIVGRKLMLEYDIGSARDGESYFPGMFLRPGERPIIGSRGQANDVAMVVDALASCVGWALNDTERENLERVYLAQPEDTRMDSFGVFPSRSRAIRLAIMGFKSQQETCSYLEKTGWPGQLAAVDSAIGRFRDRANVVRAGVNIDVQTEGVGPTLGLTLIVKQRYTKDSRYWLDGLTDWAPFLEALSHEDLVVPEKAHRACRLGFETDAAICEVRALCDAARHSPHKAGHIWKSAPKSQGLRVHGAFGSGAPLISISKRRAAPHSRSIEKGEASSSHARTRS